KQLKTTVDALSLSATPIPRTLSLALSGLRDISVIETPPVGRLPIVTHVGPFDEPLIQQAVQQEISRGGQVFYVHNRIETLDSRRRYLEQLFPGLPIGVVHGKMRGATIETVMWKFLHQVYRLLLATTIIESGLDIPTVNTLIVEEAEELGLAQLYQLRGRVGRERQRAYCYLFFSPTGGLTAQAKQRLEALREFTELGSGFRLALRDLEIRGAGNLLGAEQHGFVAAVGFDLYCQLLHTEVQRLKGVSIEAPREGPTLDLAVAAYFPEDYMPGEDVRILFYKQLASAQRPEDITATEQELTDRFGPPPPPATDLLALAQLRLIAQAVGLASIVQKPTSLDLTFQDPPTLDPQALVAAVQRDPEGIELIPGPLPKLRIHPSRFTTDGPIAFLHAWLPFLTTV
ncbi:MAG: transcription-repair coupling factor, partial [Elusimicrobia bacterium]|nr:transcription-repair coupling factor [Elusimicrobiota bacterium]